MEEPHLQAHVDHLTTCLLAIKKQHAVGMQGAQVLLGLAASRKRTVPVLHSASGCLKPGSLTLLLGAPGSGKSVLLKSLAGKETGASKVLPPPLISADVIEARLEICQVAVGSQYGYKLISTSILRVLSTAMNDRIRQANFAFNVCRSMGTSAIMTTA